MKPGSLYNILSDCHYFDVINSLLNAFRLKKKKKKKEVSNSRIQITERALQKPLFKDVLFLIIFFQNILGLVFHFKDILQYIKFVNW